MTTNISIFNNPSFGSVRVFTDIEGKVWFSGSDVATALGYSNPQKAVRDHVTDKHKTLNETFTVNGTAITLIDEAGLYRLVMRSQLPSAEDFQEWVMSEVLPSIRKTGSYSVIKSPMERILENSKNQYEAALAIADMLKIEQDKQALIEKQRDKAESEVKTLVHDDENTYTATDIAKDLGFRSAIAFNQWLKDIGSQYKQGKHWVVRAEYAEEGLVNIKLKDTGNGFNVKTMQFTNKGKLWITDKYRETHPNTLQITYL